MYKVLAVLVIITVAITGSATLTSTYLEYPITMLENAMAVVDTLIPQNQFHAENPIVTTERENDSIYPFAVDMGKVTGTMTNGRPLENASVFDLLMERLYRYVDGSPEDNEYKFPRPILDPLDTTTGDYYIYSVKWYPTLYELTGLYGQIADGVGRNTLTAIRCDIGYFKQYAPWKPFWVSNGGLETETYYFIIDNNPRVYEGTYSIISTENGAYYFAVASYGSITDPITVNQVRVTYNKNTQITWKEYVEKELMR